MLVPQGDILIVDDNPDNLDLLSAVLRQRQYRVRAVPSGPLALEAARRHPPELAMLDINMPGMDGYQTCEAFKREPALARIPIIFISALDDPLDKVKAFHVGGRDYVTKPFSAEEVLVRVEHQVSLGRLQRELEVQNQNLLDANLKLKEVNTLKTNFTAMLVHDLKSPLTVLGIVLETIRAGGPFVMRLWPRPRTPAAGSGPCWTRCWRSTGARAASSPWSSGRWSRAPG